MPDDWRLRDQDAELQGVELTWMRYRAPSKTWDHDHCSFCWAKFKDPDFSAAYRQHIAENPEVLTEGYTTTQEHPRGAGYWWVCETCFRDFAERFEWQVVEADEK